jgi:hypothetical protein
MPGLSGKIRRWPGETNCYRTRWDMLSNEPGGVSLAMTKMTHDIVVLSA